MTGLQAAFDILGISPDSDAATVKTAWRALVRSYHPDMARSDPEGATRRLAEINAAFDAIGASTEADRRGLAEAVARRRRAEAEAAARRARARAEAMRRAGGGARRPDRGDHGGAQATARPRAGSAEPWDAAGAARRPGPGTALTGPDGRAGTDDERAMWDLARKAAIAFRTAREVCSREVRPEPRSVCF